MPDGNQPLDWPAAGAATAPILVTGAPRSGSTWVGNVLALAAGTGIVYEPFNRGNPAGRCRAHFPFGATYVTAETEAPYLAPLGDTLAWRYSLRAELAEARSPRALARMARDLAYFATMRRRRARMIMKDPLALYSANWIAERFGAAVVVVIRHPAGFVASMRAAGWDRLAFRNFLDQTRLMEDRLAPFRDEVAAAVETGLDGIEASMLRWKLMHHHIARLADEHPDWTFVRHEDLCRDPAPAFRALYARLGLQFTAGVAAALETFTTDSGALGRRSLFNARRRTMRDSGDSTRRFRERLAGDEIDRIRAGTAPLWQHFYTGADW